MKAKKNKRQRSEQIEQVSAGLRDVQGMTQWRKEHPTATRANVALRAWAWQDDRVRVHQQRVDQLRLAYLEEVAYAHTADRLSARQLARVFYSIYVGSQHLIPVILPMVLQIRKIMVLQGVELEGKSGSLHFWIFGSPQQG